MVHGRDVSQHYFIDTTGQSKITSFESPVPVSLDRLQCSDVAIPDGGILRIFFIHLFAKIDGLSEVPRLKVRRDLFFGE